MRFVPALQVCLVVAAAGTLGAAAQTSSSYRLEESAFNAGGRPNQGTVATSASYRITLDSLGSPFAPSSMSSPAYRAESTWLSGYRPPTETSGLVFADKTNLEWTGHPAAGVYNLYRDLISSLSGLGFGNCKQQDIPTSTATDGDAVPGGDGFFYLVTVENRLAEEGTKGHRSDGSERLGSACP